MEVTKGKKMLEQLFGIRYIVSVDGSLYGYTLHYRRESDTYDARTVRVTPTGDVPFGIYSVPTFGHKESVRVAILDQILAMESVR
jgi:hypothetical protein